MNICLVSQQYPPETARGGIGTQTWNKATTLASLGHTVHVVCRATGPEPTVSTDAGGRLTVHRVPCAENVPGEPYEETAFWVRYSSAVQRELQRLAGNIEFDVINFPEWGAEGFAFLVDRNGGRHVPAVVHLHGPLTMFAERIGWPDQTSVLYRLASAMENASIELADALMASSAHIADFVANRYRIDRASINVVHTGVDCTLFRPMPFRDGNRRPTVLFVGHIARNKGVALLFDAVLRLRSRYPDILLRLVGAGDAHLIEEFGRRARSEGADQNVEFCGFVARDRLPEFYRQADVFASPAEYELGVANVYIEAMACGCPVIASTAGGAPEAVLHDQTGLLVPPRDVDALVYALDEILGNGPVRRRMSVEARRRVEGYFALDRYIVRVLACYEKAIARMTASAHL